MPVVEIAQLQSSNLLQMVAVYFVLLKGMSGMSSNSTSRRAIPKAANSTW
jgi:hypothetical protein